MSMADASLMFSIASVKIDTVGQSSFATDLGVTKGGATLTQSVDKIDIKSDQNSDPVAKVILKAPKTLKLNLLDASPSNLALAFGGAVNVDGVTVEIPNLVAGTEKAIKITTKPVNNVYYEIIVKRGLITGASELTMNSSDASTIPLDIKVLKPSSGATVTIEKKTVV